MAIKKDTLDQLLSGRDPKEVFSKDGLFDELQKALAERVLHAERASNGPTRPRETRASTGQYRDDLSSRADVRGRSRHSLNG